MGAETAAIAPLALSIEEYERINPAAALKLGGRQLLYATPNRVTAWRASTLMTKEPSTIEWLDAITPGEILVDVGANVGMYTIYAAVMRDARVFAFEPESQNFALLCRNIALNRVADRVTAWPCAISDRPGLDRLHISEFVAGGSCHSFGEAVNFNLEAARFPFVQGSLAVTLDDQIAAGIVPQPHHIKIDVDGFEHRVVAGAERAIADAALRSLIIEINPGLAEHRQIIDRLTAQGFRLDPAQVARAARQEGKFKGVGEYVFRR
jgi:FkbM family methyltransferase